MQQPKASKASNTLRQKSFATIKAVHENYCPRNSGRFLHPGEENFCSGGKRTEPGCKLNSLGQKSQSCSQQGQVQPTPLRNRLSWTATTAHGAGNGAGAANLRGREGPSTETPNRIQPLIKDDEFCGRGGEHCCCAGWEAGDNAGLSCWGSSCPQILMAGREQEVTESRLFGMNGAHNSLGPSVFLPFSWLL